jgi:hypothetical protein
MAALAAPLSSAGSPEAAAAHGSAHYATKVYWDARFATEKHYEWLCEWCDLAPLLTPLLQPPPPAGGPILWVLGNGTSTLPSDLCAAFPASAVLATDYSEVVIDSCQRQAAAAAAAAPARQPAFAVADMLDLGGALGAHAHFGRVDAVFDKGALDALVSAQGDSWRAAPELLAVSARVARGVHAALRPGGRYIMLSFSQPHFRAPHLLQQQQQLGGCSGSGGGGGEGGAGGGGASGGGAAAGPAAAAAGGEDEWEEDLCPNPPQLGALPPVQGSLWSGFEWHRVERGLGVFLYICTK